MVAAKVCFNAECGATLSEKWTSGWILRSGQFADLCDTCGSAFEQMRFCETFHSESEGWRKCKTCEKPVHCGCISSINLFMHLDAGGIECILCARKSDNHISAGQSSKIGKRAYPSNSCDPGTTADMHADTYPSEILIHPRKKKKDPSKLISQFQGSETDCRCHRNGKVSDKSTQWHSFQTVGDKMQRRNLGSKSKRLRIDNEDTLDLKVKWEEAQGSFCPALSAVPSVVIIEGHEFEEYAVWLFILM